MLAHFVFYFSDVERAEQQRGQLKSLQERTRQSEDSVRREREEKTTAIDRLARERGTLLIQLYMHISILLVNIQCVHVSSPQLS